MDEGYPEAPFQTFSLAPLTRADLEQVIVAVGKQTEAQLELVRTLRSQNEQFIALVEVVREVVALQKEINRDAMTANVRLQEMQAYLKMPPYDRV